MASESVEDGERDSCSALFGQGARGQLLLSAVSLSPAPSGTDRLPCQAGGAQTPCSEPDSGGRRVVQMNLRRLSAPPIRCSDIAGDLPREEHSRRRRFPFCRNGGEMLPPCGEKEGVSGRSRTQLLRRLRRGQCRRSQRKTPGVIELAVCIEGAAAHR